MQYNPQNGRNYPQQASYQHVNGGVPYGAPKQPQRSQGNQPAGQKPPKRKRAPSFYVAIVIAIAAIVAAAIFGYMTWADSQPKSRNGNAIIGQLDGKTDEEIREELNRIIEEGMFNISIAGETEFEDGSSEGEIKIENVPNNHYLMQVDIVRNDNGEKIYSSDILEPNYHIQSAKLDKDLPAGTYECTAVFHALDFDTEEEDGQAAAVITIVVKN